jgi:hypothetical protein
MGANAEPDFWRRVVAEVRKIPIDEVTTEQRTYAKMMCFVCMYRTSPKPRTEEETFKECCEVLATAYALRKEDT